MTSETLPQPKTVSGSKVVLAMFAMGILATAALWIYWTKHLEPFMPLQQALNARFKDAAARVEGGQRKLHKGTPSVLSIRLRVPFDPNADDTDSDVERVVNACVELSGVHVTDMEFDEIVVLMYHQTEGKGASQKRVKVPPNPDFGSSGDFDNADSSTFSTGK